MTFYDRKWENEKKNKILAITDHDIEAARSFKNLRNGNDKTNDETEEIKTRITAANTAYSPLHIMFRCKQIHRNNKIRLYETLKNRMGSL